MKDFIITKKTLTFFICFFYLILSLTITFETFASQKKLIIAHRGASGYLPEHTLASATLAFGMKADFLELDLVMTKDGHLIVMHDLTLNKTTNVEEIFPGKANEKGEYNVIDFRLNEIKMLNVHERESRYGSRAAFPKRFPIKHQLFKVPTLDEIINLIKGLSKSRGYTMGLYIEIKSVKFHRKRNLDPVKELLKNLDDHGYKDDSDPIFIQSFDSDVLKELRYEYKTRFKLVQLIGENSWKLSDTNFTFLKSKNGMEVVSNYADGIGPWINHIVYGVNFSGKAQISDLVKNARSHNLLIHPYTFREDRLPSYVTSFNELLNIFFNEVDVDGVFTDFPDLVKSFLDKKY